MTKLRTRLLTGMVAVGGVVAAVILHAPVAVADPTPSGPSSVHGTHDYSDYLPGNAADPERWFPVPLSTASGLGIGGIGVLA